MKTIKLVVPASSTSEMNELVDSVCKIAGEDPARLKDKFKMIDMASPKKIMDLCEYFKLSVEYRFNEKAPEIAVSLKVPNDFSFASLSEDTKEEEEVEEFVTKPEPEEVKEAPKKKENFESVKEEKTPEAEAPEELNDDDDEEGFPF